MALEVHILRLITIDRGAGGIGSNLLFIGLFQLEADHFNVIGNSSKHSFQRLNNLMGINRQFFISSSNPIASFFAVIIHSPYYLALLLIITYGFPTVRNSLIYPSVCTLRIFYL